MKLNINNYLFTYKGVDITNLEIKHKFSKGTSSSYDSNGKKTVTREVDWLVFNDIIGTGTDGIEYNLYFDVTLSKEEILAIEKGKMIDFSMNAECSEIYINVGTEEKTNILDFRYGYIPYANSATFFVGRLDNDKVLFKLSIPEEELFIWFEIEEDLL